ncbi:MAG: WXG100 family type VII secretion target [Anaerolineales bacterium]|nr:WXG100 family type VII secretion target [Anaerolineales bacterium]
MEQVSATFSRQAQLTAALSNRLHQSYAPLRNASWIGRGADAFFREMEELIFPSMERLSDALGEATRVTNAISHTFGAADEQAASPFRNGPDQNGSGGGAAGGPPDAGAGAGATNPTNEFSVPGDWLAGVTNSLNDYVNNNQNELSVPADWLAGVQPGTGQPDPAAAAGDEVAVAAVAVVAVAAAAAVAVAAVAVEAAAVAVTNQRPPKVNRRQAAKAAAVAAGVAVPWVVAAVRETQGAIRAAGCLLRLQVSAAMMQSPLLLPGCAIRAPGLASAQARQRNRHRALRSAQPAMQQPPRPAAITCLA